MWLLHVECLYPWTTTRVCRLGHTETAFRESWNLTFIPVQGRCILFPIFSFHVGSEISRRSLAWVLLAAGDGPRCLSKPSTEGDKLVLKALFRAWAQPVGAASCVVPPRAAGQMHSTPVGSSTPPSTPSIPSLAWSWSLKPGGELSPQAGPRCFNPTAERFPKSPGSWAEAPGRASPPGGSHCPPRSPLGAFTSHLSGKTRKQLGKPLLSQAEATAASCKHGFLASGPDYAPLFSKARQTLTVSGLKSP